MNIVNIDGVDYIPYYLDNHSPGNRGGNSHVLKLIEAQSFDEDEGYPDEPDLVIKICNSEKGRKREDNRSKRFDIEIQALLECSAKRIPNLMKIYHNGLAQIEDKRGLKCQHRFYTMQYAACDLSTYLANNKLSLIDKIQLLIDIANSLKNLWELKYYHRDLKPDNILFIDNEWVISDLGLIDKRDENFEIDKPAEWIGPRGWMSPESMNKFLCEGRPWESHHDCKIDHSSDLYQLGKIYWFILQGNSPEGGIRRSDFQIQDEGLYQIIRTLLNNSKNRRISDIEDLIGLLKRQYFRSIEKYSFQKSIA
ncbi:protein kinase [Robiginitalea sp. M366]|uniref:protein kinase domain-containing protein n=1 Tax=Robiginitalea aestuariiviva TaxID=3036903 RepID=UPI00240E19B1|nr:protein kinase [Robiginitalea aestuariiviva]MDG1571400.1 protein kinase [Robiginitalea aestuariiviva]